MKLAVSVILQQLLKYSIGYIDIFSASHTARLSIILKCAAEPDSLRSQHSSSRDESNCLAMLPELTKLQITAMHCKHPSTHLVTRDGREDALVIPGYISQPTL